MPSKLFKLEDGTLVEIEAPAGQAAEIAGGAYDRIKDATIDQIKPLILKAAKPLAEVYQELNKAMEMREAELEMGLGFEAGGNFYITQAKGNANLKIKLKLAPKAAQE